MQSPFDASISTTNYAPSDEERPIIRKFLQSRRTELNRLEGKDFSLSLELAAIQKAQADVKGQIKRIEQEIAVHQALLSPARTLPDDMYREIFLWCLANSSASRCTDPLSPPLLLTQVCRRWRQIAHAIPRLWTNLNIRYREPNRMPLRADVMEQWMRRSGALPMSVVCEPDSEAKIQPAHIGLFATLAPSFKRWKDLTITLPGNELDIKTLFRFLDACGSPNPFHQVETLDLALLVHFDEAAFHGDRYVAQRVAFASVMETLGLQRSTRLRKLNLFVDDKLFLWFDDLEEEAALLSSWLPHRHLQHLGIGDRSTPGVIKRVTSYIPCRIAYQSLRDLPNLITFKADLTECVHEVFPPNKYVLKKLEHMSLSFADLCEEDDLDFLPFFEFPSLAFLTVRNRNQINMGLEYDLASFVTLPLLFGALCGSLTKLILDPGILPAHDLTTPLSMLHSLVHLHLRQPFFDADLDKIRDMPPEAKWGNSVLECLTPKADQTAPTHSCPNLQYLKWENNTWFSDRALADLILHRSSSPQSPVPLKQVHINFGRCIHQDLQQEYGELVREGLDLRLNYFPQQEPEKSNIFSGRGYRWHSKSSTDLDGGSDPRAFGWP